MVFRLQRGGSLPLSETGFEDRRLRVGIGWRSDPGPPGFPLSACAMVVDGNARVLSDEHFVHDGNPDGPGNGVRLSRTDPREAPDETLIDVDLTLLPPAAAGVRFAAAIDEPPGPHHLISQSPRIRVLSDRTELALYEEDQDMSVQTAVLIAEFYRRDGGWRFRAVGQGHTTDLLGLAARHGAGVSGPAG